MRNAIMYLLHPSVVWSRDTSWAHCVNAGMSNTSIHTVRSTLVPTPHNRSQHIQANTTRGFIQSALLTMGIMIPETCWVNLLWINIYSCVICWSFLLLENTCFQINSDCSRITYKKIGHCDRNNIIYTGCPRRKGPNFGRVFLRSNYTDITLNTCIQSSMVTEILAREVWNFNSYYSLIDYQIHIETGRNMWFL